MTEHEHTHDDGTIHTHTGEDNPETAADEDGEKNAAVQALSAD